MAEVKGDRSMITENDVAELRLTADKAKMTPGMFEQGERLHLLLDVYEYGEKDGEHAQAIEKLEAERDTLKDEGKELRAALVKIQKLTEGSPDGDQALERLGEIATLASDALND